MVIIIIIINFPFHVFFSKTSFFPCCRRWWRENLLIFIKEKYKILSRPEMSHLWRYLRDFWALYKIFIWILKIIIFWWIQVESFLVVRKYLKKTLKCEIFSVKMYQNLLFSNLSCFYSKHLMEFGAHFAREVVIINGFRFPFKIKNKLLNWIFFFAYLNFNDLVIRHELNFEDFSSAFLCILYWNFVLL